MPLSLKISKGHKKSCFTAFGLIIFTGEKCLKT